MSKLVADPIRCIFHFKLLHFEVLFGSFSYFLPCSGTYGIVTTAVLMFLSNNALIYAISESIYLLIDFVVAVPHYGS